MAEPTSPDALQKQQPYTNQEREDDPVGAAKEVPAGDRGVHSGVNKREEEEARGVPGGDALPPP